jgi:hypothetical protein
VLASLTKPIFAAAPLSALPEEEEEPPPQPASAAIVMTAARIIAASLIVFFIITSRDYENSKKVKKVLPSQGCVYNL